MTKRGKHMNIVVMGRDHSIRSSLPETQIFSKQSFLTMMDRYGTVILKPNFGSGGAGVIKVSRLSGGKYRIHLGTTTRILSNKSAALVYLRRFTGAKQYIVQRYISMAKVKGRPFDLRVMVQRRAGVPWTVTGRLAKVAGPNWVITNVARSKGYVLTAMNALTRTFPKNKAAAILKQMDKVCLHAARQLDTAYGRRTLGFDMAVDDKGNVWVLEANPKPAIGFFKKLKDKTYYRRILATAPSTSYERYFTGKV